MLLVHINCQMLHAHVQNCHPTHNHWFMCNTKHILVSIKMHQTWTSCSNLCIIPRFFLVKLYHCHKITNETITQLPKLIRSWTNYNNGKITTNFNKICTSWKKSNFSFVLSLVRPSMAIFINKVLYSIITCQIGNNINIWQVLTFFKILTPFVSISFTSFINFKCLLRLLEK